MSDELSRMRSELGSIDDELLRLAGTRQRLATEIGRVKRELGLPARDFAQEREVLERAHAAATTHGVSGSVARELMLTLLRSSLTAQERERVVAEASGQGRRALVLGGAGRMGGWFARFLEASGYAVESHDPALGSPPLEATALDHDLIVVATPLSSCNAVLHSLAVRRPGGLVFDISSLKGPLFGGLHALKEAGVRVTSVHPMFGPDTELLSGRHVVFVDLGVPGAVDEAKAIFSGTMAQLTSMDLESHDRVMAYVLGLSHALNIAFFTALSDSGASVPELNRLSSSTFDEQLKVASRVSRESPALYYEIQALNDYGGEALASLAEAVERLRHVVHGEHADAFRALMERGRAYLDERAAPTTETR